MIELNGTNAQPILAYFGLLTGPTPPWLTMIHFSLRLLPFLWLGAATAQPELSTLIQDWNDTTRSAEERMQTAKDLHITFHQTYPDTVLFYLDEMRALAERHDLPIELYSAHNRIGTLSQILGRNEEAFAAFDHAEDIAVALGDSARLGTVYGNRGNVHVRLNQYVEATRHFNRALGLYSMAGDTARAQRMRMALGNIFMIIGHNELAMDQFEEVQAGLTTNDPERKHFPGLLDLNMGWCAYQMEDYALADSLYASALTVLDREGKGFYVMGCHSNIAELRKAQGRPDDAMAHWKTCARMSRELGSRHDELGCILGMAELTLHSDPQQALRMVEDIQDELLDGANHETQCDLYRLLYEANKQLGHAEIALEMHEFYALHDDSLQTEKARFAVLRAAYEKDVERQLEAVQWEGQQARNRQEVKQLKTLLALVLGFVVIIGLFITAMVRMRRLHRSRRAELMGQIDALHQSSGQTVILETPTLELDRDRLDRTLDRPLNDTDWNVLNILLSDPAITNRGIAEQAHLSVDGVGSSLRRMYVYFDIRETKYKKMALLHAAMKASTSQA